MNWLEAALSETAAQPSAEELHTFRDSIDPAWIEEALSMSGVVTLRKRRLPAEQVIWLVLGMALLRDRPIAEVVEKLELARPGAGGDPVIAPSSVAEARQRLGAEPMRWLFGRCSQQWALDSARRHAWRGLALFATDGTTLRVADSDANRAHFGLASGGPRGDSGYPLVRMTALLAVRSHLLAAAGLGPYEHSEQQLAAPLWEVVPEHSLLILDKNYLSAKLFAELERSGQQRHWLLRAKSNTQWQVVESYGRYDKRVELKVSSAARKQDPTLPKTMQVRAIGYRHPRSKDRQWLLTSLRDPNAYPAAEIVELYHERWEIELAYDEIKTHLLEREETIRSRTVEGVYQELWGILLAYNLVRLDMERIAEQADVEPSRISFVAATRYIRDEWMWCEVASPGSIPGKLRKMRTRASRFVLPPRRSSRHYPRAVKRKMSNYPKKHRSQSRYPISRQRAQSGPRSP